MLGRILTILLLTLVTVSAFFGYQLVRFATQPLELPEQGLVYQIPPGSGLNQLATDLEQREVISSAFYFRAMAISRNLATSIKAGEYHLPLGATPLQMLEIFVSGRVFHHALTLVEGWTFHQVLEALGKHPAIHTTLEEGLYPEQVMARLEIEDINPEGRFLADTYHFPRGTTDVEFLQRAWRQMESFLAAEWPQRDPGLPLASPYEAVILASIVEKETGLAAERALIAGVFVRRMHLNMRLQTDPTVIYGLGQGFDGNLRRVDLKTDTPYNTYLHAGLPPTPICMPGKDAIRAALHPTETKLLYFVAKGDGSHQFSATLEEHNAAVRKYQLKR